MAAQREVLVLCYWNGCIKYGPDGVYYEGSIPKKISVKQNTAFSRFLEGLYLITKLDKQRLKLDVIGRYPVAISPGLFRYVHLPVVDDISFGKMLEVPSNHPSLNSVELYLETIPISVDVINPAARLSSLEYSGTSSKRLRTQQPQDANDFVGMNATHPRIKLEVDNNYGWIEDDETNISCTTSHGELIIRDSGSDMVAQTVDNGIAHKHLNMPGLSVSMNASLNKCESKPFHSSLWVDEHELRAGLCFNDRDELKNAVAWCSIRGRKKCVVRETDKDTYTFECIRWNCNWSLHASRMDKEHGLIEITKCTGPHTCCPIGPENFDVEFAAEEIESLIRVQPTLTVDELGSWWLEKFGYELETSDMKAAKQEAIKKVYGDWDQSFRLLPKLMAAFQSSNGLLVDWRYDRSPNPEFASFRGVFWAFPQSVEGFRHCRPLIEVDSKDLNGKYPMKLMVASGLDAEDYYFPLAYAVTKEVSADSWRWFLTGIREKVTQRKDLCLISAPHPDILSVINEPGSMWKEPWAYHRLCLDRLSSRFHDMFADSRLKSLIKQAGWAIQQDEFDSHMEAIKRENIEAWRWLDQIPPSQWALAHDGGRRFGIMDMNVEKMFSVRESFEYPGLPVTATVLLLFDELRLYFHEGLCDVRSRLNKGDIYAKPIMDKLEEFRTVSVTYMVMPLDNNAFQVTTPLQKDRWIVQVNECTCTCGESQRNKFPCMHALAVCEKLKINPLKYIDNCYSLERLYQTYAATFNPVPEVLAWPEASGVPTLFPPVTSPPPPPTPTHISGKFQTQNQSLNYSEQELKL